MKPMLQRCLFFYRQCFRPRSLFLAMNLRRQPFSCRNIDKLNYMIQNYCASNQGICVLIFCIYETNTQFRFSIVYSLRADCKVVFIEPLAAATPTTRDCACVAMRRGILMRESMHYVHGHAMLSLCKIAFFRSVGVLVAVTIA